MPRSPVRGPALTRRDVFRLGAAAAGAVGIGAALTACTTSPIAATSTRLVHGSTGGGLKDTLDAHHAVSWPDIARIRNLYETLLRFDADYRIEGALAESWEANADATVWTFRLRRGVTFHNGKPLTAEDVHASFLRMIDPKNPAAYIGSVAAVLDRKATGPVDALTYRIALTEPYAVLDVALASYTLGIVPADYDPRHPVGTGPFRYDSFVPGQRSTFRRFADYWGQKAHYDELVILDFADDTARVNALLADQVQTIDNLPRYLAGPVKRQGANALVSPSGGWVPFTMRVDAAPYSDVRVRTAMRLIVDRQQMVDQAFDGFGRVANDLYAPFDPAYIGDQLPQRQQDIDQAKFLLKRAGADDLQVELVTSTAVGAGAVEAANLFAQQARAAGVDVRVKKVDGSIFYGDRYLSWPFAQDFYETRNYLQQAQGCSTSTAPFNECHFNNPKFDALIRDAQREVNPDKRRVLLQDAQKIEYDEGGLIIWGFKSQVDAFSSSVTQVQPAREAPMSAFRFNTFVPAARS